MTDIPTITDRSDPHASPLPDVARKVRERKLTYLSEARVRSLYQCMNEVERANVHGDFFEFGVALGGSGICMAHELGPQRRYFGFDVFSMIPAPTEADGSTPKQRYEIIRSGQSKGIGGDEYYGYKSDLLGHVRSTFAEFGVPVDDMRVALVEGLFEKTLPYYRAAKVAFAHIDCDWYDPVTYCLAYLAGTLAVGGIIALDDYNDWPGCRKATDEFLARNRDTFKLVRTRPHAIVTRIESVGGTPG